MNRVSQSAADSDQHACALREMRALSAPIAMRMPNSVVRRATEYEITPYTPIAASPSAPIVKKVSSTLRKRGRLSLPG